MKLRHLTFRLLEVYVAVIRSGSLSEAARRLHLTQPTISLQLKRLSEAVGEPLIEFRQGRLFMTAAGEALFSACQDMLGRFEELQEQLQGLQEGRSGHFSIALVNTAQYILPRLLGPFSQAFPEVEVTVEIGNRAQMMERFQRQQDDIYIFSHPPSLEHALAARFLRNPLVVIAPAQHPLAQAKKLPLSALQQERFLLREPGSATRMLFDSWLQTHGMTLQRSIQMASNEAIRVGVAAGMGIAVISQHALPAGNQHLVELDLDTPPSESYWHFIVRREHRLAYSARNFLHFVDRHLEEHLDARYVCHDLHELLNSV